MSKTAVVKIVLTFVSAGATALAVAGYIPVTSEQIAAIAAVAGTVFGGSYVNAKR